MKDKKKIMLHYLKFFKLKKALLRNRNILFGNFRLNFIRRTPNVHLHVYNFLEVEKITKKILCHVHIYKLPSLYIQCISSSDKQIPYHSQVQFWWPVKGGCLYDKTMRLIQFLCKWQCLNSYASHWDSHLLWFHSMRLCKTKHTQVLLLPCTVKLSITTIKIAPHMKW